MDGLTIARAPPWAKEGGMVVKRKARYSNTEPQKRVRLAFSEVAHGAFGQTGLVNGMPTVAAIVRSKMKHGEGAYGGTSSKERANAAHEAAKGSIAAQRAALK